MNKSCLFSSIFHHCVASISLKDVLSVLAIMYFMHFNLKCDCSQNDLQQCIGKAHSFSCCIESA